MNLVQTFSHRWGVERLAGAGTQVWAKILRSPHNGVGDRGAVAAGVVDSLTM